MKGYFEQRGLAIKLEFDAASGQFIAKPIEHGFIATATPHVIVQKIVELKMRRKIKKSKEWLVHILKRMGPEIRDDVGMTEVYAAAS